MSQASQGLHGKATTYIQEMITPSKSKRYSIRSNEERVLKVPKFKHDTFGKRAFAVYGPLAWNCLPKEIRLCDEIEAFKRNLKTHLFVKFVNESTLAIWFWRIIVKRPRMLSAQFVALYKPCKPKPKPKATSLLIGVYQGSSEASLASQLEVACQNFGGYSKGVILRNLMLDIIHWNLRVVLMPTLLLLWQLALPPVRTKLWKLSIFSVILTTEFVKVWWPSLLIHHDDVIEWKHFPRYWPFVRGIHRSPHKGQWRGALMFSLICVWINR